MKSTSIFAAVPSNCVLSVPAQQMPPWNKGANNPTKQTGCVFRVADIDNVPDLHGNPVGAQLVLFIGGNQFFVLPLLVAAFERQYPELRGRIFYETLPPGILRKQIAQDNTITLGNLTIQVRPDVYEAGKRVLQQMEKDGEVHNVVEYAINDLAIMVQAGNPKQIHSLEDLGRPDVHLSMPNPAWEDVASQISDSLHKAGGDALKQTVYKDKVASGANILTEIHHRQTPIRIMSGAADAGVTWASEVRFQKSIGNPIEGVTILDEHNTTATYTAGILRDAPHPNVAAHWLAFLQTEKAQAIYRQFGFKPALHGAK